MTIFYFTPSATSVAWCHSFFKEKNLPLSSAILKEHSQNLILFQKGPEPGLARIGGRRGRARGSRGRPGNPVRGCQGGRHHQEGAGGGPTEGDQVQAENATWTGEGSLTVGTVLNICCWSKCGFFLGKYLSKRSKELRMRQLEEGAEPEPEDEEGDGQLGLKNILKNKYILIVFIVFKVRAAEAEDSINPYSAIDTRECVDVPDCLPGGEN